MGNGKQRLFEVDYDEKRVKTGEEAAKRTAKSHAWRLLISDHRQASRTQSLLAAVSVSM